MFEIGNINAQNKQEFYKQLNTYLVGLISEETDWLAGISNASALLYLLLPDIKISKVREVVRDTRCITFYKVINMK